MQKLQQSPLKVAATKHNSKTKAKPHLYTAPAIDVRVVLAQNANQLAIASLTSTNITDVNGRLIEQLPPEQAFQAVPSNSTIARNNWQIPLAIWIEPMRRGAVFVGDRWYKGKLLLVVQGNKLLAINYVNLEEYLLSVVGSEMNAAAPIEALKAQAVAARSYALVHIFAMLTSGLMPVKVKGNSFSKELLRKRSVRLNGRVIEQLLPGQLFNRQIVIQHSGDSVE